MSTENYRVLFESYSENHFIKDFQKKYRKNWLVTRTALVKEFARVDQLVLNGRTNPPIHQTDDRREWILKHEFAIAGLRESRKSSGRRIIAYVNHDQKVVRILLVYHKDQLGKKSNETGEWERVVKAEFKTLLVNFHF